MTGLFGSGGLDLGSVSDRQERVLRREFESRRKLPGMYYGHGGDLCLQRGKFRPGRVIPDEWAHLHSLNGITCFANALMAAEAEPRLRYCEGYAAIGRGAHILHGWCIAPDDGVVEVTYPTDVAMHGTVSLPTLPVFPPHTWGYWGVTFRPELVREQADKYKLVGLLDRVPAEAVVMRDRFTDEEITPAHGYPILKVPYLPERTTL